MWVVILGVDISLVLLEVLNHLDIVRTPTPVLVSSSRRRQFDI